MAEQRLSVAPGGDHLVRDGRPHVLVADTVWSAFSDPSLAEWIDFLQLRRGQGFNTVQISVLPVLHDRSLNALSRTPFEVDGAGHYRFDRPNLDYFAQARRFVEEATSRGFSVTLVVLWSCYVAATPASDLVPWAVIPDEDRERYVALVVHTFGDLEPIFLASGDDPFTNSSAIDVYEKVLGKLRVLAPCSLLGLHSTPDALFPSRLAASDLVDFYPFQSGHSSAVLAQVEMLAGRYLAQPISRPRMNAEPPYEAHGFDGGRGRFRATDIRSAVWWSVLAGAGAGVADGAHGVWQWYRPGATFTGEAFSMHPLTVEVALDLPGAVDVGFAGSLVQEQGLYRLRPRPDCLVADVSGTRAAASDDGSLFALYIPVCRAVEVTVDVESYDWLAWDLGRRQTTAITITPSGSGGQFHQLDTVGDLLVVGHR